MTARKQNKSGSKKVPKRSLGKKTLRDLGPRGEGPKGGATGIRHQTGVYTGECR
jgi:hypothetical protein